MSGYPGTDTRMTNNTTHQYTDGQKEKYQIKTTNILTSYITENQFSTLNTHQYTDGNTMLYIYFTHQYIDGLPAMTHTAEYTPVTKNIRNDENFFIISTDE